MDPDWRILEGTWPGKRNILELLPLIAASASAVCLLAFGALVLIGKLRLRSSRQKRRAARRVGYTEASR